MRIPVCVKKSNGNAGGRQLPHLSCVAIWRTALAVCCLGILSAHVALAQQPTQPPEAVDPSPINGEVYYFINQLSTLQMDLNDNSAAPGSAILQNTRSFSNLSQRWSTTKAPDGNWKISNVLSGLCLDSTGGASPKTVQNTCGINVATQEWTFTYASNYAAYTNTANGYNAITNVGTGELLSVAGSSTTVGAGLNQTALSANTPTGSQLWLFRPAFWRGDDMSLGEKAEYDRAANDCAATGGGLGTSSCNNADLPWWHDAYLPGQDMMQIYKNAGLNAIRIRPEGIVGTIIHGNVTFNQTTGPLNGYTLNAPTSVTFPLTAASQVIPASASTTSEIPVQTDWSGIDLASRAKQLGMTVFVDLFYDGSNTNEPGLWKTMNYPLASMVGTPENPNPPSNANGGTIATDGKYIVYNYVKQEMEMYRANGVFPDIIGLGNELGGFSVDGTSYAPSSFNSAAFQNAGMQGALDAASDTSNPAVLGNPVAPPWRCEDFSGSPDLQTQFYKDTVTYGTVLDTVCQSYYPGWHGALTRAGYNWHSASQHVEEENILAETNLGVVGTVSPSLTTPEPGPAVGLPVFTVENGVAYTNATKETPLDPWYGSSLSPTDGSRAHERQFYIDLETVEENNPYHLGQGMDCWACESTLVSSITDGLTSAVSGAVHQYWTSDQLGLFDISTSTTSGTLPVAAAGTMPLDNTTLPAMMGLGGRTDPTYNYKLVNANGGILEVPLASRTSGAPLDVAVDDGIVSQHQQWKILAAGGNAEVNTAVYPAPMNGLGDGYFQIVNQNQAGGVFVLDNENSNTPNSVVVQATQTTLPTLVAAGGAAYPSVDNQEWDIMSVGNCGDIPANCENPPLTTLGDYYVIVNKSSGMLLSLNGSAIEQTEPAAASNGDWIVPASKGQLWQIVPVHISAASTPAVLVFASAPPASIAVGGNLGTVNVDVENTAAALIESPSESVTLTLTGPADFTQTVSSSAAVASFNLSSLALKTPGVYSLTASGSNLTSATASFSVVAAPTVVLTTTATLSGSASSGYTATVTVTNTGTGAAANAILTTATLGGVKGSVPLSLGTIAANGGSATVTVTFPGTAGANGAASVEQYAGTYTGGTFSGGGRAVLP
jgi:hypothetical protein